MSFDEESRNQPEGEPVTNTQAAEAAAESEIYAPQPLTEEVNIPEEPIISHKKSKKPLLVAICCAVLVVALGVLAAVFLPKLLDKSFCTEMERLSAKMETLSSFSFDAELSIGTAPDSAMPISMDGEMTIDSESNEALMHMEYGYNSSIGELYIQIANKQLTYYFLNTDGNWYRESIDLQASGDVQGMDWNSLFEQAGLSSYIQAEQMPLLQKQLEEKLQDDAYLGDVWGYNRTVSSGDTVYAFSPDWSKVIPELLKDAKLLMTPESYEELLQPSEEMLAEALNGIGLQAELTADAQHYPKAVSVTVALSDELIQATQMGFSSVGITVAFSDYNNASVEIPEEVIQTAIGND